MPFLKVETTHGIVAIHYLIAAPGCVAETPRVEALDRTLPTVLLIHPELVAMEIFHSKLLVPLPLSPSCLGFRVNEVLPISRLDVLRNAGMRRFNLVALDLLGHGETAGEILPSYGAEELSEDVSVFMVRYISYYYLHVVTNKPSSTTCQAALNLPPCFVCAVSMGTIVAVQYATTHPDRVLGLFLLSPICTEEVDINSSSHLPNYSTCP